jgi:peptidyl-prolyl isomerase D
LRYVDEHPVQLEGDNPETIRGLKSLETQFHLNLALVQLKASYFDDAIKSSSVALELDGLSDKDRAKAFYRRGMAYGASREEDMAVEDLKRALELSPGDAAISNELSFMREKQKLKREKEKMAYGKMFS